MSMPPKRPAAKSRPVSGTKSRAATEVSPVRSVGRQSPLGGGPRSQSQGSPSATSPVSASHSSPPRSSPASSPPRPPVPLPDPTPEPADPAPATPSPQGEGFAQALAQVGRTMSETSIQTLRTLEELAREMEDLERRTAEITHEDPAAVDVIGQLFGTVQKLLEHRIDAVSTVELTSGQQDARDGRKELVRRANGLLDRLVQLRTQVTGRLQVD
eukprot:EG_transcript_20635